ncbi:hypothetical protein M2M59_02245 [Rummeliibacillus sp. G93]|uniref:hypothetical protein n=1 Tax=Rummeliibacillus TaxID=648802 RepID=UPI00116BD39D|nr:MULTISPECIES: hypothetical protein [Rummeliibacillus]MBB5170383.1 hypothetical protein [Rummeliibacillus stabekisii]UQW97847.1 hypothetical protein M2M59_02245 [Rummeliibacillus sp. G93]GEL04641.1 hypothetical protein RST01_12680 [Rummeliibacillus stabekisii]
MDNEMYKSSDLNPNEEQKSQKTDENEILISIEETIAQNRKILAENREILPSYRDSSLS